VIIGYEYYQPKAGCFQCDGLSSQGLLSVILLVILFWPLAWIPCLMPSCFETYQRPVYGWPAGQAPPMPPPGPAAKNEIPI
jgi:hypothetical protein